MSVDLKQIRAARTIFFAVMDLESNDQAEQIRQRADGDVALILMVESLLGDDETFSIRLDNPPTPPRELHFALGQDVGPYRLDTVLGVGGMGAVFAATHRESGQRVALKTLRYATPRIAASLRHEIASLSRLRHPSVVQLLAHGLHEGMPWAALELIEGESLQVWLDREGTDKTAHALHILQEVALALAWLHGEGIIHRDLKPANILINTSGSPILVDFGIAEQAGLQREQLSSSLAGAGTLQYMAPEQKEGIIVDARADLHALGCLIEEVVLSGLSGEDARRGLLQRLCARLQSPDPTDRPGYASDIAATLAELEGPPDRPLPTPRPYLYRPVLTGRDAAMATLSEALDGISIGSGEMVLLAGPPGSGRTRLLASLGLMAQRRRIRTVWGRGLGPALGPLHLWRELVLFATDLRQEGAGEEIFGANPAHLAARFPGFHGITPDTHSTTEQQRRALSQLLEAIVEDAPLLLLLDDLHLVDLASLSILRMALAEQRPNLLIAASLRSDEATDDLRALAAFPSVQQVTLRPLSEPELSAILASALSLEEPLPGLVVPVAQRASGNPYAAMQILREAVEAGIVAREPGSGWSLPDPSALDTLPRTLPALEAHRLARLPRAAREIAYAAALLGVEVRPELLEIAAAVDLDTLTASLRVLEQKGLLERDPWSGCVRFARREVWELARSSCPADLGVVLHGRAAVALKIAQPERLLDISSHLESAGDQALAAATARECAQSSFEAEDYQATIVSVERYVRTAPRLDGVEGVIMRSEYVRAFWVVTKAARGAELAQQALDDARHLEDEGVRLEVMMQLARGLRYNNQNQEALAVLEELQGLVRASNDQSVLFAVYTNQNQVLARLGLIDEAIAVLWEAHTIACEGGRLDGQQSALRTIGTRYHLSGRSEEAIQPLQQALALDSEGYKPHVGLWLARALLRTGRTSEAREVCLEALRRARLLGLKNTEIQLLETLARFEDGESCIELMRQARALASAQQLDLVVANISVKTGLRLLGFGRPDEAAEMFDAAEARLRVGGRSFASIPIENHLRFGHASLLEVREEWEALVTVVEALMPNANPQIKEQISLMLAHALRKLGRETGRAERLARQALADAQHRGGLLSQVRGHIELGWHALLRGDSPQVHLDALTALMPGIVASQEQHLARKVASLRRAAEQ